MRTVRGAGLRRRLTLCPPRSPPSGETLQCEIILLVLGAEGLQEAEDSFGSTLRHMSSQGPRAPAGNRAQMRSEGSYDSLC